MITRRIVRLSARVIPAEERSRWRDEWLAELDSEPDKLHSLRFALGICAGIGNLAKDLYRRRVMLRAADPERLTPGERKMAVKLEDANMMLRGR